MGKAVRDYTSLHTGSDYVNQIGLETDDGSERIKAAYGLNYERLVTVKKQVRSDEPVPPQPEHQTDSVEKMRRAGGA